MGRAGVDRRLTLNGEGADDLNCVAVAVSPSEEEKRIERSEAIV